MYIHFVCFYKYQIHSNFLMQLHLIFYHCAKYLADGSYFVKGNISRKVVFYLHTA